MYFHCWSIDIKMKLVSEMDEKMSYLMSLFINYAIHF